MVLSLSLVSSLSSSSSSSRHNTQTAAVTPFKREGWLTLAFPGEEAVHKTAHDVFRAQLN